jgi:hypothetical protein
LATAVAALATVSTLAATVAALATAKAALTATATSAAATTATTTTTTTATPTTTIGTTTLIRPFALAALKLVLHAHAMQPGRRILPPTQKRQRHARQSETHPVRRVQNLRHRSF